MVGRTALLSVVLSYVYICKRRAALFRRRSVWLLFVIVNLEVDLLVRTLEITR